MLEYDGNKCGKCQNHDYEVLKKGHARDCPFKKCECLKCRLLDARSDILQVISGKETKLKGTKKDPNCGFCQNHGIKILRKGHVRSCGYGQERHFRLDNCFDCEVHYIRNEVNRLQIKMRRAMKEDRMLSDEQKKTAREAITREEVEKVCDMARLARRKRGVNSQQVAGGEPSMMDAGMRQQALCGVASPNHPSCSAAIMVKRERHSFDGHNAEAQQVGPVRREFVNNSGPVPVRRHPYHSQPQLQHPMLASPSTPQQQQQHQPQLKPLSHHQTEAGVWRPWSHQQQQIVAAMAAQQHQHQQQLQHQHHHHQFETRHLSQPSPQFINQMQLHQSQAQVVDCTMRHQQHQFGSRGNSGTAIDSAASLFDREPHNSSMAHGRMLSMPELHQPVDLKCTLQQSTCASDPSQSTSSHNGPNSNRFFASHQANITQAHSMFDSSSQYQQQQQQQHHERTDAKITNYDAQSVAGGQPSDEAIDPELDIMSSPDRSYYASNESSVESLTPIRVVTPPADSANININLLVSSPANLGNIQGNNHNHHANNNNNNNSNNNSDNSNSNNTITQNQIISQINANSLLSLPQDQPLSLIPRQSREMQLFNTLQLFRLMLQFSVQNQNAN